MEEKSAVSRHLSYIEKHSIEVIPNEFYFVLCNEELLAECGVFTTFSVDKLFVYNPFEEDFGPLDLACTVRYCRFLKQKLESIRGIAGKKLLHYSIKKYSPSENSVCLIGAFQILALGKNVTEALLPFESLLPTQRNFRDASVGEPLWSLSIRDSLRGLYYAVMLGWMDFNTFDPDKYDYNSKLENGGFNWLIPQRILAFSGPIDCKYEEGMKSALYIPIFKAIGVSMVVRLNEPRYDKRVFTSNGIKHADLFFVDGSCPSWKLIKKFKSLLDTTSGVIAVHCLAGLGRTGTLIGCYAMQTYRFPAAAWIGWNRLCRPGSILGRQQIFLLKLEKNLFDRVNSYGEDSCDKNDEMDAIVAEIGNNERTRVVNENSSLFSFIISGKLRKMRKRSGEIFT